tara:strand:+ start:1115 stop:1900 length:786 start_codon:yes stop_codon:yes gene_type:complete
MLDLNGRVAVITGGSGALGFAVAQELNSLGAKVILLGRSSKKLKDKINNIDTNETSSTYYTCDVSDEASLMKIAKEIFQLHSKVDILVTCAAAPASGGKFEESSLDEWHSLLSTDLDGVYLACRIFGKSMIEQSYGRIVNFTSFHNVGTYPYRSGYNAAKSAVEGLSRALAVEWGHYGITVNTVAPGPILTPRTEFFLNQDKSNLEGMLSRTPNVRLGNLEDVSSTVAFLVSSQAKHINGQQIVIDGGWTKNTWWGNHVDL